MKQVTTQPSNAAPVTITTLETFPVTLRDGRTLTFREMTGRDLLYMEEDLKGASDLRRTFSLASRLSNGQISFDEVADLVYADIRVITEAIGKAGGPSEDETSEDGSKEEDPK